MYICIYVHICVYIYIYICIYETIPRTNPPRPNRPRGSIHSRSGPTPREPMFMYIYVYIYIDIHR